MKAKEPEISRPKIRPCIHPYFYFKGIRVCPTAFWLFSMSNAPLFIIQRNVLYLYIIGSTKSIKCGFTLFGVPYFRSRIATLLSIYIYHLSHFHLSQINSLLGHKSKLHEQPAKKANPPKPKFSFKW